MRLYLLATLIAVCVVLLLCSLQFAAYSIPYTRESGARSNRARVPRPPTALMDAIQAIELSIYLDRSTNSAPSTFTTGTAAHYMDGALMEQERCPFLKFRYHCHSNASTEYGFDGWTMSIHPELFEGDIRTVNALQVIRRRLHYYESNLWTDHFGRNLVVRRSVFVKRCNVLLFGKIVSKSADLFLVALGPKWT